MARRSARGPSRSRLEQARRAGSGQGAQHVQEKVEPAAVLHVAAIPAGTPGTPTKLASLSGACPARCAHSCARTDGRSNGNTSGLRITSRPNGLIIPSTPDSGNVRPINEAFGRPGVTSPASTREGPAALRERRRHRRRPAARPSAGAGCAPGSWSAFTSRDRTRGQPRQPLGGHALTRRPAGVRRQAPDDS